MTDMMPYNYQLKWHSHGSHLHSSVATLYRSDNFTDVTLVTGDGRFLSAHRFVLSACSSYLSRLLQIGTVKTSHSAVIVMPPEISYRTLAILLQYMYSGEATVTNDQLNGVLRAGEVLRIKGLCREKEASERDSNTPLLQKAGGSQSSGDPPPLQRGGGQGAHPPERPPSSAGSNDGSVHRLPSSSKHPNGRLDESVRSCSEVRSHSPRSDKINKGSMERITDEISIEENMKIELLVKEEPLDWNDNEDETMNSQDGSMVNAEVRIKAENVSDNECEDNVYAPLTCDMCHETFKTPALWVRHIETHPLTDIPRRKRRRNEDEDSGEEDEYPELRCELCEEVFGSPADWVRHIQSEHTEGQLALANHVSRLGRRSHGKASCPTCSKSFPSIASMLIHSRTHTGERPYVCDFCEKGFNVKSNLLRHLRTLHDHLIAPEEAELKRRTVT